MQAILLDGKSSKENPVVLSFGLSAMQVAGAEREFSVPFKEIKIQERFKNTARRVRLPANQELIIPLESDERFMRLVSAGFGSLTALRYRPPSIRRSLIYLFSIILIGYYAYALGLPPLSKYLAAHIPEKMLEPLGKQVLETLDHALLKPTALSDQEKAMVQAALGDLELVMPAQYKNFFSLQFRRGAQLGANAMALPGGIVLVTDEIVKIAASKERILSVLAHELGHHVHKHMLQKLVQGSLISAVLAMIGGDIASLTTGLASMLMQARYSQALETEADDYAATLLKQLNLKPELLGDMLTDMDKASSLGGVSIFERYLSSHPATSQRVQRLHSAPNP